MQQLGASQPTTPGLTVESGLDFASLESLTFQRLFEQHGPLVTVENTLKLLSFKSRDSFNRAVNQRRVHLTIIRPSGRNQSFVATSELASYLAALASPQDETAP